MSGALSGAYRAFIEAADDFEERSRYRVRVVGIHDDQIPVEHLPWAEQIPWAGTGWGDVPPLEPGDRVIVMPEGGSREYWFIIGGWIAAPSGKSDLAPEMVGDYETERMRWCRADKAGNLIEMSSVGSEKRIRIKSGNAVITITQMDDSITIEAEGPCSIKAKKASITSEVTDVTSPLVNIVGQGVSGVTETGVVNIFSNKDMNIFAGVGASVPTQDGKGTLQIGQYKDALTVPRQTNEAFIGPKTLKLGKEAAAAPLTADGFLHTDLLQAEATTKISFKSTNGAVEITCKDAKIAATGKCDISSGGDTSIDATGKCDIKSGGDTTVDAAGKCVIKGTEIDLGDGTLGQIVTTMHNCAFTGAPHPFGSSKAKAAQ